MRASCAPYKFCKNKTRKKQRGGSEPEEKTQLPNLQESADILRSSLGIHRQGQNAMWENQVIRLALQRDERFTHLLGEEPLVAQKEQDTQDGGRVKRTKKRKTRKLLPKLRKISYKNKKHHYKLKDPFSKRKLAIHEGVNREAKKTGKTKKKAAIAKKGRFNILRIYRKNKKIKECNTITHDMRYMDRKYGLGKTKNICGQKGGTYNFPPDRPDSTFSNIDDLKFILSFYSPHNNNKIIIKSYTGDEDEHQLEPELASDTHILIVGAYYGIPFSSPRRWF